MNQDPISTAPYPLYDGLYREYHPTWGRWLNPDLAGLGAVDPSNPQSWNRYAYVTNNPLALSDPSGLLGCPQGMPTNECYGGVPGFWAGGIAPGTVEGGMDEFDWLQAGVLPGGSTGGCSDPAVADVDPECEWPPLQGGGVWGGGGGTSTPSGPTGPLGATGMPDGFQSSADIMTMPTWLRAIVWGAPWLVRGAVATCVAMPWLCVGPVVLGTVIMTPSDVPHHPHAPGKAPAATAVPMPKPMTQAQTGQGVCQDLLNADIQTCNASYTPGVFGLPKLHSKGGS